MERILRLTSLEGGAEEKGSATERVVFAFQSVGVYVLGHALAQVGTPPGLDSDPAEQTDAGASYYDTWFEAGLAALHRGFSRD